MRGKRRQMKWTQQVNILLWYYGRPLHSHSFIHSFYLYQITRVKFSKLRSAATYLLQNRCLRRLYFLRRRNIKNSNSLCFTFIVTEIRKVVSIIPLLVHETETDSGNGRTATAKRLRNNGNVMLETRHYVSSEMFNCIHSLTHCSFSPVLTQKCHSLV